VSNPSGAKGTAWETKIERLLQEAGYDATRIVKRGAEDHGDVEIRLPVGRITVEAKNERKYTLNEYVEEASKESENAGTMFGVAWVHRARKASPADGYVVMSGAQFIEILRILSS